MAPQPFLDLGLFMEPRNPFHSSRSHATIRQLLYSEYTTAS